LFLGLAAVEAPSVPSIRVRSHPSPRLRVLIRPSHPVRLLATPTATPDHQPNADPRQVGAQVISVEPSAAATVTVSAAEEHLVQVSTTIPGFTRQGAGAKPPLGHGRGGRRGPGGLAVPVARIELLSAALRAAAARRPTRPRSLGWELRRSSGTDPRDQMIPWMRSRPGETMRPRDQMIPWMTRRTSRTRRSRSPRSANRAISSLLGLCPRGTWVAPADSGRYSRRTGFPDS